MNQLSAEQTRTLEETGVLHLGAVAGDDTLALLQQRMDDIMLGKAPLAYDKMLMQLDSADGNYNAAGPQTRGFKGPTLGYRKIEGLEFDPVFLAYMQLPIFRAIADYYYPESNVSCFRAMFMNKPARKGTDLPLHQDRWNYLDRDPLVTLYTALDDATVANGCVWYLPGSHKRLLNPAHDSGFLTPEMAEEYAGQLVPMELKAGEVTVLHNWVLHRSGRNSTPNPRRAFSVCLMDSETRLVANETLAGQPANRKVLYGTGELDPNAL